MVLHVLIVSCQLIIVGTRLKPRRDIRILQAKETMILARFGVNNWTVVLPFFYLLMRICQHGTTKL